MGSGIRQVFPRINWFLLRGLGRENAHWHDLPPMLRKTFPDDVFVCLDQPGCGTHWQQRSPWQMTRVVEFVHRQYLDTRAQGTLTAGPSFFLGLSLGAMIAVAHGVKYPGEFRGAVLINTSLPGMNTIHSRLRPAALVSCLSAFMFKRTMTEKEKQILSLVSNDPEIRRQLLPSWVVIQRKHPVSSMNYLRMLVSALTCASPLESPFHSTLILRSAQDRLIDSRCSQQIGARWQVPLQTHPTAGHDLSSDDPAWVVRQIETWLG